jgi:hypothetical protein
MRSPWDPVGRSRSRRDGRPLPSTQSVTPVTYHQQVPDDHDLSPGDELLLADLEDFLAGRSGASPPTEEIEAPVDEETAAGMMRALRWVKREVAKLTRIHNSQVTELDAWLDDRTGGLLARQAALERALEGWTRLHNVSSRAFPAGKVALRAGVSRIEFTDPAAYIAWCETNRPALLKRPDPEVSKSNVNTAIDGATLVVAAEADFPDTSQLARQLVDPPSGQVVPGVVIVVPRDKKFTATPKL